MTEASPRLETAIRKSLAPLLREDGFKGSGRRFYRIVGPWIEVLTVQGSKWGGSFCVNLAIHFAAAPDVVGAPSEPSKMTEAHCEFRRRLSEANTDQWWEHAPDAASMNTAVCAAAELYVRKGRTYFSQARRTLEELSPLALVNGTFDLCGFGSTATRLGLALARIRQIEGNTEASKEFAKFALQNVGSAIALKQELRVLAEQ
jgi:Domain of unknown function (DUF4304)